ncbi:hypothetical protein GJ496_005971 [Pomphorhynchus laevis]|nr:hypothetical protein GJ496_005971 [Pomphorhynchus laevis]
MYGFIYDPIKKKYFRIPPGQPQNAVILEKRPKIETSSQKYSCQSWLNILRHREINGPTYFDYENFYTCTKLTQLQNQLPKSILRLPGDMSTAKFCSLRSGIVMVCRNDNTQCISLLENCTENENSNFKNTTLKTFNFRTPVIFSDRQYSCHNDSCNFVFALNVNLNSANIIELINIGAIHIT